MFQKNETASASGINTGSAGILAGEFRCVVMQSLAAGEFAEEIVSVCSVFSVVIVVIVCFQALV